MMASVKYSQTDICSLMDFGSSDSIFYSSELGLAPLDWPLPEAVAYLQLRTSEQEVVFPGNFLLSPQAPHILVALKQLPCKKRLAVDLSSVEFTFAKSVPDDWQLDILFHRTLRAEDLLELKKYPHARLVFVVSRRFDQFEAMQSVPEELRSRTYVLFLSPGLRSDIFFNADEVMLFQRDWVEATASESLLPLQVLAYRPLLGDASEFFNCPSPTQYVQHFATLGGLPHLRSWMLKNPELSRILFLLLRPVRNLVQPLRKFYWYLDYKIRHR